MTSTTGGTLTDQVAYIDAMSDARFDAITNDGTIDVNDSTLGANTYVGAGLLRLRSTIQIDAVATLNNGTRLEIGTGSQLLVGDRLRFLLTDESDSIWFTDSTLTMTGGVGATVDDWEPWAWLEVAGTDVGPSTFNNSNFDLTTLELQEGAHVVLVDHFNNGNRGGVDGDPEALYLDNLGLPLGSVLNLNGLHLLVGGVPAQVGPFEGGEIIDIAGPSPTPIPTVSERGMASMALLILTAATLVLTRRRATR